MYTGTTFPQSDYEFVNDVPVMIWTQNELANVVDNQPCDNPGGESVERHVTFLHEAPTDDKREDLPAAQSKEESSEVCGRDASGEFDKVAPGGGRFSDAGKKLGMGATRRNWDVVTAIQEIGDRENE